MAGLKAQQAGHQPSARERPELRLRSRPTSVCEEAVDAPLSSAQSQPLTIRPEGTRTSLARVASLARSLALIFADLRAHLSFSRNI